MVERSGRDRNLQWRVQVLRITSLLLRLPLRLRLLLFLELHFLVGGYPPLDSPPPPPPVFECHDAVERQHKQCYDKKCRESSRGIRDIVVGQLQAYTALYNGKTHQKSAIPRMDIPYEQDFSMGDSQALVNKANEGLESCQAYQGCTQLRVCSVPIL